MSAWPSSGEAWRREGATQGQQQQGTQKLLEPAAEQAEVVGGGGEHGIGTVAVAAFEMVAAQAVIVFEMADDRLDGAFRVGWLETSSIRNMLLICFVDIESGSLICRDRLRVIPSISV